MNETSTRAYWDSRDAELRAALASDAEYAASPTGRRTALYRQMDLARSEHNDVDLARLGAEMDAIDAGSQAAGDAEWTRETTIARRADWNRRAADLKTLPRNRIPAARRNMERELGYTMETLACHIVRHGL